LSLEPGSSVLAANEQSMSFEGYGNISINLQGESVADLHDVLYVPTAATNLLSVSKATSANKKVVFDSEKCYIYDGNGFNVSDKLVASGSNVKGVYLLE